MDENEQQLNKKEVKVLRTYGSDMVEAVRTNEISVIKIALAEKEKREHEEIIKEAEGSKSLKIILTIGGIILIAGAIFGSIYLIQKKKEKDTPIPIINNIETFISYDSITKIDASRATNIINFVDLIKADPSPDSPLIKAIFLTTTINKINENLSAKNFLAIINSTAPSSLVRSLSDKFLFGKYINDKSAKENDKLAYFLIFQTNNYTQTYASMLEWEKTMLRDLFLVFDIKITDAKSPLFEQPWKDIVINNKDARILYGENGEGILYYVFVNKNNFIVTSSLEALKENINRLIIKNPDLQ